MIYQTVLYQSMFYCAMMMTLTSGSGYIFALRKLMCRIHAGKIVHQYVILKLYIYIISYDIVVYTEATL